MNRVYTAPGCGPCFAIKHAMRTRGIPFEEVDATTDDAKSYLESLGYRKVPVTVAADGTHWHGMDMERIVWLSSMVPA